ncbi:protein aubergine [Culex quinquefasciatus]|nr:protein aubergine [Culex quinquefasciatus]
MSDRQAQGRARARGYTAVNLSHEGHEGRGQAPVRGSGVPVSGQGPRPSWGPGAGEGRAMVHREHSAGRGASSSTGNGNGDNGNGSSAQSSSAAGAGSRGAMRGRRTIGDTLRTRALDAPSKQGTMGQPLQLTSNYFKLLRHIEWTLHQYRVDFAPQCASARLMQGLIKEHKKTFGGFLFDGTQLFMVNKLRSEQLTLTSKHERTGDFYQIKIVHTGTVDMTNETGIQVLNLILRRAMGGLNLQLVGRNLFDAAAKIAIREYQIELWPGYVTSIRQHEQDILVCCEIAHKTMRMQTCYDILRECQRHDRNYMDSFKRAVLGVVVLTDYNNKTYTINDVSFDTNPQSTFETKNGKTSFVEYYQQRYNIRIRDAQQPMLLSRAKKRDLRAGGCELMALVPELCRVTGLTDQMRSDFRMMKAMSDHTRLNPDRRIERLNTFNNRLQTCPESADVFKIWQMELDRRLVELPGRMLPQELIFFSPSAGGFPSGEQADWSIHFRNNPMFSTVRLNHWYLIVPNRANREASDFLGCLIQAARGMRFEIDQPEMVAIPDDNPATYVRTLDNVVNRDPQMIMCVVSNNKADRYTAIKKKCCVDRAIPTQVMVQRTITPKGGNVRTLMSVATKVVIQMNCKLGGVPWKVKIPLSGLMTVGFDVCHDTKDKPKSFGAMVATFDYENKGVPKYFSTVSQHTHGEEISNYLPLNTVKALDEYRKEYGELPKRIIFYRDGVGEGQLHYVYEHEVKSIVEKLGEVYKKFGNDQDVLFTYFIVSKRINTRFFERRNNPKPGTVVDDIVTLPERTDFYLVSQSVRQGTVSPTAYNVIYDTSNLKIDHLQMLSYKQCHLYYNWSGTTRVPAVCQYAHKLAFLVGQFLHQSPSNLLEKKLYFL